MAAESQSAWQPLEMMGDRWRWPLEMAGDGRRSPLELAGDRWRSPLEMAGDCWRWRQRWAGADAISVRCDCRHFQSSEAIRSHRSNELPMRLPVIRSHQKPSVQRASKKTATANATARRQQPPPSVQPLPAAAAASSHYQQQPTAATTSATTAIASYSGSPASSAIARWLLMSSDGCASVIAL